MKRILLALTFAAVLPWTALADTVTLAPVADAFTISIAPGFQTWSYKFLEVQKSAQNDAMWSFLRFDLQSATNPIPPGSTITSASMELYLSSFSGQAPFPVQLYSVNQPWSETTLTWSNQPPPDTFFASTSVPGANGWVTWNVTTLVQQWVSGSRANQGVALLPGSTNEMSLFFPSREEATNQPLLVITFQRPLTLSCSNIVINCGSPIPTYPPPAGGGCSSNLNVILIGSSTNGGACAFTITRTWLATDSCNNSTTCTQMVSVVDLIAPVLTCATNKTVECGSNWTFDPPSAFDTCCGTNVTITVLGTQTNLGPCVSFYTRTWQATDCCTNSTTCSQTLTVRDTLPPVLTCATNKTVECGSTWSFDPPSAFDTCCGTNVTITVLGTQTNLGPCVSFYTRTWRATDCCSNSATCTQVITVSAGGPCVAGETWTPRETSRFWEFVASSADGSKLVAVTWGDQIYTSTDSGVTWIPRETVRLWASVASSADGSKLVAAAGGSLGGGQIYTSTDSGATWSPRESNRVWESVASSADGSKLVAAELGGQIYTSTDSGVTWTPRESNRSWVSVASSANGSKLVAVDHVVLGRIYTSTDSGVTWTPRESGRPWFRVASSADGSKLVAVVDGGQIYTSSDSGVTWTPRESNRPWACVASSADGSKLVAAEDSWPDGGQIYTSTDSGVTWTPRESNRLWGSVASSADGSKLVALDTFGQIYTSACTGTVLMVNCATNKTVECGSTWTFDPPTAIDACCGTNVTITVVSTVTNGSGCSYFATRTWLAMNCCTNSATCSQTVTVRDSIPPAIACASNRTVQCGSTWAFDPPSAFDTCCGSNVIVTILNTITNGSGCALFAIRTWQAQDCCTNTATCSQTVTILDTIPPLITCAPNKPVECGSTWTFDPPTAIDACCGTNVTITVVSTVTNGSGCSYFATRTWRAIDCCTNVATCSQTVTVRDSTPPVLTCATNKTVECGGTWTFDPPSAFDTCCGSNVTITVLGTQTNLGPCVSFYTRTWQAIDCCTNAVTCSQTITVRDTLPPVLTCATNKTVECGTSWSFDSPTAFDTCCGSNVTISVLNTVTNSIGCPQIITRTWRATDCCTNSATCSQTVTVRDTTPPVITCLSNLTVQCLSAVPPRPASLAAFLASGGAANDTCDANLIYSCFDNPLDGGFCGGTIQRTHTVSDHCTNAASCVQIITINDITPPVLTCTTNKTVECGSNWTFDPPSAYDTCCGSNVTITVLGTQTNLGPCVSFYTRTWQATDCCTNSTTCSQTVTIRDITPPTILCPTNMQFTCPTRVDFTVTATDTCNPNPMVVCSPPSGSFFFPGVTTVTCTARDACSNSASCTFTVTVLSNCPPPLCATNIIGFETIPGIAPVEGLPISSQFLASFGVSFRRANGTFPLLARRGSPVTGFIYPNSSSPPTGDFLAPGDALETRMGDYFLTLDGPINDSSTMLIVDFANPVAQASGYILDIDNQEKWIVKAYSDNGITGLDEVVLSWSDLNVGDGGSTPWQITRPTADIRQIRFIPMGSDGGVGFDLLSFSSCPATNCIEIHCPTGVTGYACGTNCAPVYFTVTATNHCNPTNVTVVTDLPSGACFPVGTTIVHATAYGSGQTNQCAFPVTVLPFQETKITVPDTEPTLDFGHGLAVDGATAVFGAPFAATVGSYLGAAYVAERNASGWSIQAKLEPTDDTIIFGFDVAISGNTIIVGAPEYYPYHVRKGSAYVFVRSGASWVQEAKLTATDGGIDDAFGISVAIDGDTAVVGASGHSSTALNAGAAYVFVRTPSGWAQQAKLEATDLVAQDYFGTSVAISGNTIAVGAPLNYDLAPATGPGKAYIFVPSGGTWVQQQKLVGSASAIGDTFGAVVTIDGGTVAVGAPFHRINGPAPRSAYVFTRSVGIWNEQARLTGPTAGLYDYFAYDVAVHGNRLVVGNIYDFANGGPSQSSAYVFDRVGTGWIQQAQLLASDGVPQDFFGLQVAQDGSTILVNALADNDPGRARGSVYAYEACSSSPCLDIHCPTNVIAYTCGTNCVPVYFKVTATDRCNATNVPVVTDLPSGYCFPLGTTWVNATAYGNGQSVQCTFSVTILPRTNCPPSGCAGNLIVNGSFEQPDVPSAPGHSDPAVGAWLTVPPGSAIPGWQVIGAPVSVTRFPYYEGYETLSGGEGLQAVDLTGEVFNGQGGIQQTVVTTPGGQYLLRFMLGVYPGSYVYHGPVRVRVTAGAVSQVFVHDPPGTVEVWSSFEMPFTADTSGITTVRFENLEAQHESGLDNVCLTPSPTNCLVLHCPTNIVAYTCGTNCVPVYYNPWAENLCSPNDVSVVVSPPSGTCLTLGVRTVDAWAFGSGQTNHCSFTVTVLSNCPTNCTPAPSCLIAWWRGEGNALDAVGANHGTLQAGATFAPGKSGQAFSFDEVNGYVDTPMTMDYSHGATFELWVKTTDDRGMLLSDGGGDTALSGMGLFVEPGGRISVFSTKGTDGSFNFRMIGPVVSDGSFHHVAATWTGDTLANGAKLYLDGELVGAATAAQPLGAGYGHLQMGMSPEIAYWHYAGLLDEVSVYNCALSAGEIQAIFAAGSLGKCPPSACSSNLLVNGSFELPGLTNEYAYLPGNSTFITGWKTLWNGVEYADPRSTRPEVMRAGVAEDGAYVIDLDPLTYTGGGVEQTFPTIPGKAYHASFYMTTMQRDGRDGTGSCIASAGDFSQPFTVENHATNYIWQLKRFSFLANSTTTTLSFTNHEDANLHFAVLDDVRVTDCCIELICPHQVVAECQTPNGAPVAWTVIATNHCGPNLTVSYTRPPGSWFPPGTTYVTCTASGDGFTQTCTFTVIVAGSCGGLCEENLLQNGSFELPGAASGYSPIPAGFNPTLLPGWTVLGAGVDYYDGTSPNWLIRESGAAPDGSFALDLIYADALTGGVEQFVSTVPGERYTLSFFAGTMERDGSLGTASLEVSAVPTDLLTSRTYHLENHNNHVRWDRYGFSFRATSASTLVKFMGMDDVHTHFVGLDDVRLSRCPPSTLTSPSLTISLLPGCLLQVCWNDLGSNYVLQSSTSLTPPVAWQGVDVPVTSFAGQSCVVVSNVCEGTRFFRLALGRLPVLSVLGPAVGPAQFAALAAQLNLPSTAYDTNGAVLFTEPNNFMRLPTEVVGDPGTRDEEGVPLVAERLLFDQINQIQVFDDQSALQLAQQAFSVAGLMPTGIVVALREVVHAQFSAVTSNGTPVSDLPIDTKVRHQVSAGGIPIVGPGAKASITFGENGLVTHINYSLRQVTAGPTIPIPPPHVAYQTALSAYQAAFGQQPGAFALTSEMVYYAPPAEFTGVQTLFPHFQFGGTFTPAGGSNVIQLRTILLPAVTDSNVVPRVQLVIGSQGNSISAQAVVNGGQAPYRYRWGSCTTVLTAPDAPSISYQATGRSGVETLVLIVTDANGLNATASANISLGGNISAGITSGSKPPPPDGPAADVGTEWIGTTAGLDRAPANAAGFISRFGPADAFVRFTWGEGNAFERDFKDPLFGGDDSSWVDNVDAVFYTGHANGDGWVFTSSQDDGFLRYSEARYGQNDLEWLVIAACGPLQLGPAYNAWWQRWGPAFQGLHLLCGYDNNSSDTTDEGRKWADYMLRNATVADAWTRAGIETQSAGGLRVGVMGVLGAGGLSNRGDHFWGHGSVGPDIRSVVGCWITLTPVD